LAALVDRRVFYYLRQGGYVFVVSLYISNFAQKHPNGFACNFHGKEEYLYSAFLAKEVHSERSGSQAHARITQLYLQITPCLPFLRERSPDGTTTATEAADIQLQLTAHLSTRKDERLSWPSWLTYSGWFTHINGHPSATGHAQDSESTPAKDRCYTAGPRNQPTEGWPMSK